MLAGAEIANVDRFKRQGPDDLAGLAAGRSGRAPVGRARRDDIASGRWPGHRRDRGRPGNSAGPGLEVADAVRTTGPVYLDYLLSSTYHYILWWCRDHRVT